MWALSPWDVRPTRGGQGGNKDFEEAAIEALSKSSKRVEVLVEGKLGRSNANKLADAKQASALLFSCLSNSLTIAPDRGPIRGCWGALFD